MRYWILLFLPLLLLAGCAAPEIALNANHASGRVTLRKNQTFQISLESNPTTGYAWEVSAIDEDLLQQLAAPEFTPQSDRIGAGGIQTFHFRAIERGETQLTLVYRRPWEANVPSAKIYTVTIIVR
jgi:inhibitor of cysteine peptidase